MGDWIDRLTKRDAQAILDAEVKTRIPARDERGALITRYVAPTKAEMQRIQEKANG